MNELEPKTIGELGALIRHIRQDRGLTIEELAQRSSLSASYIATIERGLRDPGLRALSAIARGLGISLGDLLGALPEMLSSRGLEFAKLYGEAPEHVKQAALLVLRAHQKGPPDE